MVDYPMEVVWAKILLPALVASGKMLLFGSLLGGFFGFLLAVSLFVTGQNGLRPNPRTYQVLSALVSSIRSFPFVVLIVAIIPVTRFVTSSSIGWVSALLPLTVASTPFFGRMFENHRIQHGYANGAGLYGNDVFAAANHIGGKANTVVSVGFQRIQQIHCDGDVLPLRWGGWLAQE